MMQKRFRQKHLILILLTLFQFSVFAAKNPSQIPSPNYQSLQSEIDSGPGFTVNFTDVSVIEYMKFLSKVADLNFIFNEEELNFTITIVSEEPTDLPNLISALVQVLRINGFSLLEDSDNLLIHKNDDVKQIAPIVSPELPFRGTSIPALITRVYKINNGNPTNIARVLKPMLSATSLLEVSEDTRHLIISDTMTNIDMVSSLLISLDAPQTPLDIDTYAAQNSSVSNLVLLVTQIITPIAEGNPVILVPQESTNMMFIVSTPFLIEKTLTILEDLDAPPVQIGQTKTKALSGENVFLYQIKYKSPGAIETALRQISNNLEQVGFASSGLTETIASMRYIKESRAILFTGDPQSLQEVQNLLATIDTPITAEQQLSQSQILIYKIENVSEQQLTGNLDKLIQSLDPQEPSNEALIQAINSRQYLADSNSFIFRGSQSTINRLKNILPSLDTQDQTVTAPAKQTFFLYKLKFVPGEVILDDLTKMVTNLKASNVHLQLVTTLQNIQWIKSTNSLYITGTESSIDEAKVLIAEFDVQRAEVKHIEGASTFFIYKPKYSSPHELITTLSNLSDELQSSGLSNPALLYTIASARIIQSSDSVLFTGTAESITRLQTLLDSIDVPSDKLEALKQIGKTTFLIYKVKYVQGPALMRSLRAIIGDLKKSAKPDDQLITTLNNMRYVQDTNSIVFTGTPNVLEKVRGLLEKFDSPDLAAPSVEAPRTAPSGYLLYEPKYVTGPELIGLMKDFEDNLMNSGVDDKELFDVINHLQWMEKSASILISGEETSTKKVENLLVKFDVPGKGTSEQPSIETFQDMSFLIYKLQYHTGSEIESALQKIGSEIKKMKDSAGNTNLVDAINATQWIQVTNSIISSGDPATLSKLKELIESIDVPLKQVFIEVLVIETTLSNSLEFGLRWGSQGKYKDRFGFGTGSFQTFPDARSPDTLGTFNTNLASINPPTVTPTGQMIPLGVSGFDLGIIGDLIFHKGSTYAALGSLINALRVDGDSTIVLNQKLITQDNKNSTLFVGSNLPFTGSTTTTTGVNTATTTNLEYRDIGVNLSITPTVGDNDIVTLVVDQQISEVTNNPNNTGSVSGGVNGIATTKSSTSTTVTLPNKHFVVISGMLRNTTAHSKQSIPCLGGLPIVGALFSQNDRLKSTANVLVFIRPHIIHSFEEYQEITVRQEDLYRSQAEPENFDAGLELVKTPDDE